MAPPILIADRYALGPLLGAGGMAQVFRARDQLLAREVAVKVFGASIDAHGPDRVQTEIHLLAGLSHPSLVTLHDAGTDTPTDGGPERAFLVMQFIDGPTLAQLIAEGPLDADLVARVGAGTADALAYVHSQGVVHRDIKPANILLDSEHRPHLADFGIAQTLGLQALTATGFLMGTAPYLSPEQVQGQAVTAATDIYSLGLVLLEALTGRREYPGMSAETALARLSRPPVIDATLPAPWPDLLTAMTASDPADRPAAAQVVDTLRGAVGGDSRDAATTMLAAAGGSAAAAADPTPTRLLAVPAVSAAAPEPGAVLRVARLARTHGWDNVGWHRRAILVIAAAVALALLVAAAAALGGAGGAGGAKPAPTPTAAPTTSAAPSTPAPRVTAATPPGPSHKGKGHRGGK